MTAPVIIENPPSGAETKKASKVSFVMPSKFTMQSLPRPTNAKVQLKQKKQELKAAVTFSGPSPREEIIEEKKRLLIEKIQSSGYKPVGDISVYQVGSLCATKRGVIYKYSIILPSCLDGYGKTRLLLR